VTSKVAIDDLREGSGHRFLRPYSWLRAAWRPCDLSAPKNGFLFLLARLPAAGKAS
jgi:hypothetical protein